MENAHLPGAPAINADATARSRLYLELVALYQHSDQGRSVLQFAGTLESAPELQEVPTLSLHEGLASLRLKLWDEDHQRLISFREAARAAAAAAG